MNKGKIDQEIVLEIPLRLYYKVTQDKERVFVEIINSELDLALEFLQKIRGLRKRAKKEEKE